MTGLRGEQCTATSKASGVRCRHLVRGGGVCHVHGGKAPQVRRKRLERVAIAEALARDPRRDPSEVLADVVHQSDWLMRKARGEVRADKPTVKTMAKLLELTEQAGRWAKTSLDAEIDQRQTRVVEAQAVALAAVIQRVLERMDLTDAQMALIPVVVPEELERISPRELEAGNG